MTRETKIGLLVGLAFIIVIGILLSDHLSVTAEPPQAALVQAGKSVRDGIAVPGAPTASGQTQAPVNVVPQQAVPTYQDLHPPVQRQDPVVSIQAGGQPQYQPPITIQHHAAEPTPPAHGNYASQPSEYQPLPRDTIAASIPPAVDVQLPSPSYDIAAPNSAEPATERELVGLNGTPLSQLAQQFGEQVVGVNDAGREPAGRSDNASSDRGNTLQAKEYVATEGDSLSKIAARFYGRSTKESRELIVKANPSLKDNPNLILAGRTYLIPQKGLTITPAPQQANAIQARDSNRPAATVSYTVKDGDTLWKIAKDQCGSAREVQTIRNLNKDVLKGGDTVVIGMTLRLPNKTVASVQ